MHLLSFRRAATLALVGLLAVAIGWSLGISQLAAQQPNAVPRVETAEGMIRTLGETHQLAIDRPLEVASFVFAALKERVKVYPTENYYYFRFIHDGASYTGNFRLSVFDRDSGKLHFAYNEELGEWKEDGPDHYQVLDAGSGFVIERVQDLVYRVTHRGRSVVFELNDLSGVKPPSGATHADETFIGPIFDESALRFFLFFNRKAKAFHYVLDETVRPIERFDALKGADRILVGRRTAFAFYRDHRLDRKILIGVFRRNALLNTYYDGPFDQLPENFIVGETLRGAIVDADPKVKGKVGRLGEFPSGARYAIDPYMLYDKLSDLRRVDACARAQRQLPSYYRCFVNPPR
jgi:hypothetical protein